MHYLLLVVLLAAGAGDLHEGDAHVGRKYCTPEIRCVYKLIAS